jgi:peptidoglycan lytic transglycosylase
MVRGRVAWGRGFRAGLAGVACLALANCSSSDKFSGRVDPRYGVSSSPRVVGPGEAVPKGGGTYRVGRPYVVGGQTYVPEEDPNYRAEGLASWYGDDFHGRQTANGEVYDMHGISAAHPTLPLPSYARVTNLSNGRSLIVRVNDRGPYHNNRLIDLSVKASRLLDFHGDGLARVRVEYVGRAPLEGSDDSVLLATLRQGEPAPPPSPLLLASARNFLPQFGTRMSVFRGAVPVPPDRPYALGDGSSDATPASDVSTAPAERRAESTRPNPRPNRMPRMVAEAPRDPVASFAPARAELAPSVMTGRGLY